MPSSTKQMIGDYRVVETIGRGVSGKVKLGIHVHTGEQVAIKIIPRQQMNQSSLVAQAVERELAVLQLLDHPHLVELRHVMQDTMNVYFVMEYMNGGDLYQVLSSQVCGRLSEYQARSYFGQLVGALTWCHTHHICHRDLKLENILLDKNTDSIKIADFGMAIMQPTERLLRTSCGSPHYASPEIIKGIPYYGPATDTWSCGVILYILLTGYHPFEDKRTSRLIFKIKNGHYNKRFPTDVSASAKDLIARMLTVDPSKRIDIHDVLTHAWMAPLSAQQQQQQQQQQQPKLPDPWFEYDQLIYPLVNKSSAEIEGWIWETLKILWRDLGPNRILSALSSHGPNVQKLTYRLLHQRNLRLLGNDSNSRSTPNEKQPIPIPASSPNTGVIPDSYISNSTTLYDQSSPSSLASCPTGKACIPSSLSTKTTAIIDAWRNRSLPHQEEQHFDYSSSSTDAPFAQSPSPSPSSAPQIHAQHFKHWHPFYVDSKSSRLAQHTTKSASISPTLSIGSSLHHLPSPPPTPTSIRVDRSFDLMSSLSNRSMSNETLSSSSVSSSIASSLTTSSLMILGQTMHYCENLYQQAHSLLNDLVSKRQAAPSKVFSIGCSGRNAWDVAGKFHQVLKENYSGQLCHRGYSHGQMVWTGSMQVPGCDKGSLLFVCYIPNVSSARRVLMNFSLIRGDVATMAIAMGGLLKTLNEYERQAKLITDSNEWMTSKQSAVL